MKTDEGRAYRALSHPAVVAATVLAIGAGAVLLVRAFRGEGAPPGVPERQAQVEPQPLETPPPAAIHRAPVELPSRAITQRRPAREAPPSVPPMPDPPAATQTPAEPTVPVVSAASSGPSVAAPKTPPAAPPRAPAVAPVGGATTESDDPSAPKDPDSDRSPPSLQSVRFDPPEVEDGGTSTLFLEASDDLSGPKMAWGSVRSPSGAATLPFGPQDQGGSGSSAFKIAIPRDAESGVWYLANLSLIDRAGNTVAHAFGPASVPPGATLRVVSAGSDSTPPEVLRIWMDDPVVNGGDAAPLHVEARDDRSGVASISGFFHSPSKAAQIWFNGVPNAQSGIWDGEIRIPLHAECGNWTLQNLRIVDEAGNIAHLPNPASLLAGGGFRVASEADCDASPPTLDAFALSPTVVSNETATEILVTASVGDVGSGAVALSGWFEGPVSTSGQTPRNNFACSPDRNDPSAPWIGKIVVPQYAAKGVWKVGGISVQDKARNFRHYTARDPVLSGAVFEVR